MNRVLKFLPLVFLMPAIAFWGASFNSTRTEWETTQRVVGIALFLAAGALAMYAMRKGLYSGLTTKGLLGFAVGAIGFMLLVIPDDMLSPLGIVGIFTVIGAGSMIQDASDSAGANAADQ